MRARSAYAAVAAFLLVVASGAEDLDAQEAPVQSRVWVGGGLGVGYNGERETDGSETDLGGAAFSGVIAWQNRSHLFSLRGHLWWEVFGDAAGDLGLLYGRARDGERSSVSISAGLSLVRLEAYSDGLFSGGGPSHIDTGVGVPVVASASFRPTPFLGFGLEAFANLNGLAGLFGATVFGELGRFR